MHGLEGETFKMKPSFSKRTSVALHFAVVANAKAHSTSQKRPIPLDGSDDEFELDDAPFP